ncbi:MAG: hypothetical protein E6Q98_18200 [Rhodospirillaceae bacterium]|nr:MAG: hypothetical protein E6Q98_18200 [Rhodospirillaceae bacterium]
MSGRYKVGDDLTIEVNGVMVPAKVETYRLAERRQILTLSTEGHGQHTMVVDLPVIGGAALVAVPPADIEAARTVALTILAGGNSRLPVGVETNLMAAAVVALTGGAT